MKKFPESVFCQQTDAHKVLLRFKVDADLFWFQGHFPVQAILPGVTQIHWAIHYAYAYLNIDGVFAGMERIKFQQPIYPDEEIQLSLVWAPEAQKLSYEYAQGDTIKSHGKIKFS